MKNGIISALIIAMIVAVVYFGVQVAFSLLNMASTMWNTIGYLMLVVLAAFAFYEAKDIIKALNNKNEN